VNLEKPDNSMQKVAAGLTVLVVIALLAAGASYYNGNQAKNTASIPTTTTSTPSSSVSAPASSTTTSSPSTGTSSGYKDGTYSATSEYYVPHGSETIKVTLTVKDGNVTDSSVDNSEYDRESALFQEQFASEYKSSVVDKPISSLQLNYVAGASDTTQGFNDALQQIKTEARA
jgi:uncharacterized protein with FMN-binding domain